MLVLSRKTGEDIYIGEQLRLVVLEQSRSGEIRLGFEGPRSIAVVRGEIATHLRPRGRKHTQPRPGRRGVR